MKRKNEDELSKMKRSSASYYCGRYSYEYELSEDDNSINADPPKSSVLDLVSTVRINLRLSYILRLSGGDVDETLDSIQRCFYMRLYLITGYEDYIRRLSPIARDFCQWMEDDIEYDVNQPEGFLTRYIKCHGVLEDDVIEKLIADTKDFVNQKRMADSLSNRVVPIAISIKVYTLQQQDETIDDAKQRAITTKLERVDKLMKLLQQPPPYKFMIEFDDHQMLGDCCICLSRLSVGEEVLFLSCSHAYHYDCLICWLDKVKQCPLCRCPINLQKLIECFLLRADDYFRQKLGDKYQKPAPTVDSVLSILKLLEIS